MDRSKRLLIVRRRLVLAGIVMLPIVFGVRFLVTENIKKNSQREQAIEWKVKAENACRYIEQLQDVESALDKRDDFVDNLYEMGRQNLSNESYQSIVKIVYDCQSKSLKKFREATPTTQVPIKRSDAESLAEGNTCSQQWRLARSETLSGTSDDSRLRATVYACKTYYDWFLGAIENSEYNDSLLAVICASEPNAPLCG